MEVQYLRNSTSIHYKIENDKANLLAVCDKNAGKRRTNIH